MFILVISNTDVASIPGITVAGKEQDLIKYTPIADAEFLFYGRPKSIDAIPVTPEGHPTPGIITKASKILANFPLLVVRSGTLIEPKIPFVNITNIPGNNIAEKTALPYLEKILENSELFGHEMSFLNEIYIGESVPGGTTTAQAVLTGLGYESTVSSASQINPIDLKMKIVKKAIDRIGIKNLDWYTSLKELGDPMMAFIVGFSHGYSGKIFLAGGTQMLAVAALMKESGKMPEKILTTKYVINDKSATFEKTAKEIGIDYYKANLDFSKSKYNGLKDYEKGIVKEGVGAGGSIYIAEKKGINVNEIIQKVEEIYGNITGKK
ncbi:MAG: nicotinate mononucleotide-dependent phosphoribosyltransferase CobT [Thermoplasmata archaeon]|nr:TIGR00303 family protein [Thermoplasmata archaeon]